MFYLLSLLKSFNSSIIVWSLVSPFGKVPNNDGTTGGGVHVKPGDGGGTSGISGIGLMALATQNVREINFSGTMEQWNKISKTLPWIRDATNLNNSGGIKCKDGNIKVKAEETQNGSVWWKEGY